MADKFVNLRTGNQWVRISNEPFDEVWEREQDGVQMTGQQPQFFRQLKD